mgnify:CR=1 FL=1
MSGRLLIWFCWLSIFLLKLPVSAQIDLRFFQLTTAEGLSESNNSYLSADRNGYMWIGGFDGYNRYDGKTVQIFRPELPDGSRASNVSGKIFNDSKQNIWFSSNGGVHSLSNWTGNILSFSLTGKSDYHHLFHLDREDRIWVVAGGKLHVYDTKNKTDSILHELSGYSCSPLLGPNGEVKGAVNTLIQYGGIEVFQYQGSDVLHTTYFTGQQDAAGPKATILFVYPEGDSVLWLPSNIGLIRLSLPDRQFQIFNPENAGKPPVFWEAAPWQNNYLWVTSSNSGLFLFDKSQEKFIEHFSGINLNGHYQNLPAVQNVAVQADGTLWISVWGKGVFYAGLHQSKFRHLLAATPGKEINISSVCARQEDRLFALSRLDDTLYQTRMAPNISGQAFDLQKEKLPSNILSLTTDLDGDLWALGENSLYLFNPTMEQWILKGKNLPFVSQLIPINRNLFILISQNGLFWIDKRKPLEDFSDTPPLTQRHLPFKGFLYQPDRVLLSDQDNSLYWYTIRDDQLILTDSVSGTGYCSSFAKDLHAPNPLWTASNKGLLRMAVKERQFQYIKGKKEELTQAFHALQVDRRGRIWLSSNNGMYRYDPAVDEVKHYTESDGLQGRQFAPAAGLQLSDGRMVFAGTNGLNVFHPDSVRDNAAPPLLHFTGLVVNDTGAVRGIDLNQAPQLVFPYRRRTLTFQFNGIDYSAPLEVSYRYQLAGIDPDTVWGGNNNSVRYPNLPHGDYTFRVWAANSDGIWTPEPVSLQVKILPPWWQTWWFRGLFLVAILGFIYAIYRRQVSQIKREAEAKRKEAELLQREAEAKQLAAELQNTVLRLQMNPHFIFNSLSSISSYILKKDVDTANDYLLRFARLMRLVLNLAKQQLISVSEEVEILEQYLATEAIRFENRFEWRITIDPDLDPDETVLPTMILQPFVENAVVHGVSGRQGGNIRIDFVRSGAFLLATITDNGQGRAATAGKRGDHASKALDITRERLQRLSVVDGVPASVQFKDLTDTAGHAAGTRVEVRLPLEL